MRRQEEMHNTPEQARDALAGALALLTELGIAADSPLAPVAFTKAVDLLAAKQVFFEQPQLGVLPLMDVPRGRG